MVRLDGIRIRRKMCTYLPRYDGFYTAFTFFLYSASSGCINSAYSRDGDASFRVVSVGSLLQMELLTQGEKNASICLHRQGPMTKSVHSRPSGLSHSLHPTNLHISIYPSGQGADGDHAIRNTCHAYTCSRGQINRKRFMVTPNDLEIAIRSPRPYAPFPSYRIY